MKSGNLSFPHPVLGLEDDIGGSFSCNLKTKLSREKVTLILSAVVGNKSILKLVQSGQAGMCLEVICKKTLYRKVFTFDELDKELVIDADKLRGTVSAQLFIIALKEIPNYSVPEFNLDYMGYQFHLSLADTIGCLEPMKFLAEKSWLDFMSVSSFMEIQRGERDKGPVLYNLERDKVIVILSHQDYEKYQKYKESDSLSFTFHSSIVYPALIYILTRVISASENYEDKDWFLALKQRALNSEELKNIESWRYIDIPKIAQQLLENPLERNFQGIEKFINSFKDLD